MTWNEARKAESAEVEARVGELRGRMQLLEDRLLEVVRTAGLRMVGPNCMGMLNTDPAVIGARTGTATYTGSGGINATTIDNSSYVSASGNATLNADFVNGTISGTMNVSDSGHSVGGFTVPSTTVTINQGTINGNGFSGTMSLTPADFNLQSVGTITYSGNFYEHNGTSVAANSSGTGVANGSGLQTIVNGGFIASE